MTILSLAGVTAKPAVCDFLGLTFPLENEADVNDVLSLHLGLCGGSLVVGGLWHLLPPFLEQRDLAAWVKRPGTVKVSRVRQVLSVGFSGVACLSLRENGRWGPLLADLAAFPHKLTRLDVNRDYEVAAPPYVSAALAAGLAGGLRLSRKSIAPQDVRAVTELDCRGVMTGTCYLGERTAEVSGTVYDKRQEREKRGFTDPGPLLRVELRLANVSASLRDALEPAPIFHHYSRELVPCPSDVPSWRAAGEGFFLEPAKERDYWRAVQRGVEGISAHLRELAALADRVGVYGRRMLLGLLAREIGVPAASAMPFERAA